MAELRLERDELTLLRAVAAEGAFPAFPELHDGPTGKLVEAGLIKVSNGKLRLSARGGELLKWAEDARSDMALVVSERYWNDIQSRATTAHLEDEPPY